MAIHDFECPKCGRVAEDVYLKLQEISDPNYKVSCAECGEAMVQTLKNFKGFQPFRPYVDHHIAEKPVEFRYREERAELMKKTGKEFKETRVGEPGCMV